MENKPLIPMLFCEHCGWKRFIKSQNDLVDLIQYKMSNLQKFENKDKISNIERKSGYKCKKCGRVIFLKNIIDTQQDTNNKIETENIIKEKMENEKNWFNRH